MKEDMVYVIMDNDRDQMWAMTVFQHRETALCEMKKILVAYKEMKLPVPRLMVEAACFNTKKKDET